MNYFVLFLIGVAAWIAFSYLWMSASVRQRMNDAQWFAYRKLARQSENDAAMFREKLNDDRKRRDNQVMMAGLIAVIVLAFILICLADRH